MRTTAYWKFGGGYSYRTPRSKKTGWSKTLAGVPASAKKKTPAATKKKPQKNSPKKRRKKTVAKKKTKSKGNRILGSYSIKGLLLGSGVLTAAKIAIPQAGAYGAGGSLIAAGAAAKFLNFPGKALLPVGVMVFLSEYIAGMIGGGGIGIGGNTGGYDY